MKQEQLQDSDLEDRIVESMELGEAVELVDKERKTHRPLIFDYTRVFGRRIGPHLGKSIGQGARTVYHGLSKAVWHGLLEPLGGLLSYDLKQRIEGRVGKDKFNTMRATIGSYGVKAGVYSVGMYALLKAGIPYEPQNIIGDSIMFGLLLGFFDYTLRYLGSDVKAKRETPGAGDSIGFCVSWLYKEAEKITQSSRDFLRDVASEAREENQKYRSGKVKRG